MRTELTVTEFARALAAIGLPGGRQRKFLQRHVDAVGHAATMTQLAKAARYASFHGMNLQYGLLARRIGEAMGQNGARLSLLVDFLPPREVTNREWVLVMRPEFAKALRREGWVR